LFIDTEYKILFFFDNYLNKMIQVEQRLLGSQGLSVSCQGLGTAGMTAFYFVKGQETDEEEKINTIGEALKIGINYLDTAWLYQNLKTGEANEELVGKALKKFGRKNFVVGTKFGIGLKKVGDKFERFISGRPDFIREQLAESLKRLDTDYIDLYTMHRMDPNTPIEETMKCLLELQKEGKIRYVALSECTSEELVRAHKIMPISAIQMEWSLNTRDIENDIVPVARKLGVGIVAYSPLGRGMLSGTISKSGDLYDEDFRKGNPRFIEENLQKNLEKTKLLEEYAKRKGYSAAQISLAWVHSRGKDVFPIPGTKSTKRLLENAVAAKIILNENECREIEEIVGETFGARYDEGGMKISYQGR